MYCGSKGFIAPEVILGEYVVARDLTVIIALTRGVGLAAVQVQRPCGGHVESRRSTVCTRVRLFTIRTR